MNKKGFTLIELLVVIAIIGLLATLAVVSLGGARADARDGKRQADIRTLQSAVELFINDNANPPAPATWTAFGSTVAASGGIGTYLAGTIPIPPASGQGTCAGTDPAGWTNEDCYVYCTDATNYLLAAPLEQNTIISGDVESNTAYGIVAANHCIAATETAGTELTTTAGTAMAAGFCADTTPDNVVFCLGR